MNSTLEKWTVEKSANLYNIRNWGAGYFNVSQEGHVVVTPFDKGSECAVSLMELISGIRERGLEMPTLLRIQNLLDSQISRLHTTFRHHMTEMGYTGDYKGVYPIKVNQQQQVVEEVTTFGKAFHHGLEAGSKAELIAAISLLDDPDACLVCNGYKDEEFVDLGLYARKMGINVIFVLEMPDELDLILRRADQLEVKPSIGVRIKLSTKAGGQWAESGGDRSVFGLTTPQVVAIIDTLRRRNALDCLELLHYHIGSQIPNIRDIRSGVLEACRIYRGLVDEGAPMGYLDLGGGLAVDYDGSKTNFHCSRNYSLDEYCADIVETVISTLDGSGIAHPTLITESGRSTVAYYSILLFNVLDVAKFEPPPLVDTALDDAPELIKNMMEALKSLTMKTAQECFNDILYYRDELKMMFRHGRLSLREVSLGESIFWHTINEVSKLAKKMRHVPEEFGDLDRALSDIYYGNFSLFQSLPDIWAIDQLFPIMPIHRLHERPTRNGILADITCDCDGKIDSFIDMRDIAHTLPLHELRENEEYYLGVFLVGAYQETLGDLHNLLGDTNVVSVRMAEDGSYEFVRELEGDSVADVLGYVEYEPKEMIIRFRERAERAVRHNKLTPAERKTIMDTYCNGLRGYTYYER